MRLRCSTRGLAAGVVLAALMGTSVALQVARDRQYPLTRLDERVLYVRSGALMQRLALSFDTLVADVYWIRAIQHYGGDRRSVRVKRYDLLYPLLDLTTTMDSRFAIAYRFGSIFLSEPYPGGAGRPDLAIALLKKGINQTPARWEYYHDLGFVYYWRLGDFKQAALWFERGGNVPGGPWWLKTQAAVMLARGGDRQTSRMMWRQMYEHAEDKWLRENSTLRLAQLDALDQIDRLEALVHLYRQRTGSWPESWDGMAAAGLLAGVPADPAGMPYLLNGQTGRVTVSGWSPLYPLPIEPPAAPGPTS